MKKLLAIVLIFLLAGCSRESLPDISDSSDKQIASSTPPVKEFNVTARDWEFSPSTIIVNQGDFVRLRVKAFDDDHGVGIAEYGIDEHVEYFPDDPSKETIIEFIADKKGEFTFYCSVSCGIGHDDMKGKFIVK